MTVIEWKIPAGAKPDWLTGAAATRGERAVMWAGSLVGVAVVGIEWLRGEPGDWAVWQYLLAVVLAWDMFGGAVSNAANSTKRQYFGPDSADAGGFVRILRSPIAFTALHVYPFVIVALYPGGRWTWACAVYAGTLAAVVVVERSPRYLQRPVAMALFCLVFAVTAQIPAPPGWWWFTVLFLAKLLLAHAVREEPYRPRPGA